MRHQPSEPSLVNDDVHIFDEIGRRGTAMAPEPVELARLDGIDDRLQVGGPEVVDALGIDDGPIGEDLEEHPELAAVIGAAQGESGQDGIGGGDRGADAGLRRQSLDRSGRWPIGGRLGQTAERWERSRRRGRRGIGLGRNLAGGPGSRLWGT